MSASAPPEPPAGPRAVRPLPAWAGVATRLVHAGRQPERNAGSVVAPIYQTSTFHYPRAHSESDGGTYLYTRNANPTIELAEARLRELDGGAAARLFASGMAAMSAAVLSIVRPGDEVVALADLYGGTTDLLRELRERIGIRLRELSDRDARAPERALGAGTRLAVIESPTNPLLRVHDIARWAAAADRVGALLLVDGTFASPINQRPLDLGADLVVHSATKYLGGHADLMGGVVVGAAPLLGRIDPLRTLGATPDPFAAYLLVRSLTTLALRVERQNATGGRIASSLGSHPAVRRVYYPGSADADQEAIAARQMRGRGGVIAVDLAGGAPAVERFLDRLDLVHVASSFGGVESLASVPVQTSHRRLSPAELVERGIGPGLVRLSFGVEEPDDLLRDLTAALDAAGPSTPPSL